jgi:lysophospholipase L1-like esterase
MRRNLILGLITLITFLLLPIHTNALVNGQVSYVAIGDSLAAGQTPNREIDTGYSDLIAQEISRNQPLAFYSKDLAFPGFTTADVLERVQSEEAKSLLANANVITISAGANDLLRLIRVDVKSGSLSFQQIPTDYSLNKARENMTVLLTELKKKAPKAQIYVMGYYFAYPHVRDSQKIGIGKQLDKLNIILARVAKEAGVNFVSVNKAFGQSAKDKIPNPTDVHPNVEGYRAMANSFLALYSDNSSQVTQLEVPKTNPTSFEELLSKRKNVIPPNDESATLPTLYIKGNMLALTELRPMV